MSGQLDLPHLQQWIGREDAAEDIITPALAARFHATLGGSDDPAPLGAIVPQLIHFCLCQPAVGMAVLGEDGHPARGGFLPPVPLPRRMWAGSEIDFRHELKVGDAVRRTSRIAEVTAKTGRTGTLCFVLVDHEVSVDGETAIRERQTIVYREAASGGQGSVAAPFDPAPRGDVVESIDVSPTLLFRYSALTFNAHRIHYDHPYATEIEGYPGLVVHGPLQASLLIQMAARCHGNKMPARFSFRGASPAFGGQPLELNAGKLADDRLELWTAQGGGPVTMHATAGW